MTIVDILGILQVVTVLTESVAAGTKLEGDTKIAAALVDLAAKVNAAYEAEVGQPMDLSKLTPEEPIS